MLARHFSAGSVSAKYDRVPEGRLKKRRPIMSDSYSSIHVHVVFSTRNREAVLTPPMRERLYPYLGGIAQTNGFDVVVAGGTADHVHVLLRVPTTMAVSKAVQLLKGGSSKWLNETFDQPGEFRWQAGFGAFSIGVSGLDATRRYIESQEEHHRARSFRDEYVDFLERHGIEYDERHV